MSTLKLVNLQHQSSNTPALVLNANNLVSVTGNLNVSNNLVVTGNTIHTGTTTFTGNVTAGNLIVSGATTIGGTSVVAVTPGTSANVMTSNGTAWVSSAPASTASLTLLATLTTTSGTTQSATGLATTYTNLLIVFEGTGNSTGSSYFSVAASVDNGSNYGTAVFMVPGNGQPAWGTFMIFRANASASNRAATADGTLSGGYSKITTLSASPINALRFSWNGGYTFNAGTIYIYGWN